MQAGFTGAAAKKLNTNNRTIPLNVQLVNKHIRKSVYVTANVLAQGRRGS